MLEPGGRKTKWSLKRIVCGHWGIGRLLAWWRSDNKTEWKRLLHLNTMTITRKRFGLNCKKLLNNWHRGIVLVNINNGTKEGSRLCWSERTTYPCSNSGDEVWLFLFFLFLFRSFCFSFSFFFSLSDGAGVQLSSQCFSSAIR